MAPIVKSSHRRRTCKANVPPILSLRKRDLFDNLIYRNISNPFQSSNDKESSSNSSKCEISQDESFSISKPLHFPGISGNKSTSIYSINKKLKRKKLSRVQKLKVKKSSAHIELEKNISDFLERNPPKVWNLSRPIIASTPLKRLAVKNEKTDQIQVSPITSNILIPAIPMSPNVSNLESDLSKLSIADVIPSCLSINVVADESSAENFFGFPSFCNASVNKRKLKFIEMLGEDKKIDMSVKDLHASNDKQEMNVNEQKSMDQLSDKDLFKLDNSQEVNKKGNNSDIIDSSLSNISKLISEETENDKVEVVNNEKYAEIIVTSKQDVEEDYYLNMTEEKEPDLEECSSTENPVFEKENVIILCEQESLAEDDEDKSENVSSAVSSDQEGREGISSSDLESNSIDEEKDVSCVDIRRHSFEKISPRKSDIVGPFTRRRYRRSIVPSLPEGSESFVQSGETDPSSSSTGHYMSYDNLNDQTHKSISMFSESVIDFADDERVGKRSPPTSPALSAYSLYENSIPLDPLPENLDEIQDESEQTGISHPRNRKSSDTSNRRRSKRLAKDLSPSRQSPISRPSVIPDLNMVIEESDNEEGSVLGEISELDHFILPPNKMYRRSLSVLRNLSKDESSDNISLAHKGRGYDQFVEQIIKLQSKGDALITPTRACRKSLSVRRLSLLGQRTPPRGRRASRVTSIFPSSAASFLQCSLRRPDSLSTTSGTTCNRLQFSALKYSPQTVQNISRYSKIHGTLKESTLFEGKELQGSDEAREVTFKDQVMLLCEQKEPVNFLDILDDCSLEEAIKVGEGVYGEVFLITRSPRKSVLKIIPIEGDFLVNGEKQKSYEEIYSELLITKSLDLLRNSSNEYMAVCFAELIGSWIVKGKYPEKLIELWNDYDEIKGSDNDKPDIFNTEQLYLILELANAGTDLESYSFSTARQALSIFKQTVFAIAVAETSLEFEHRDLHWGNVLISRTAERDISFILEGKEYKVITNGVKSTIIDFTLSRLTTKDNIIVFNDIGQDPDMFIATGDYQFEIYRQMKKDVCDRWEQFVPKTNVRWLHYLIDKMIKKVKYQLKTAKVHRDSMRCLQDIESWILNCDNSETKTKKF